MINKKKKTVHLLYSTALVFIIACAKDLPVSPELPTYFISGRITTQGAPSPDIRVVLAGEQSVSTKTDSLGDYTFTGLKNGIYSLKPQRSSFIFSPMNIQLELADTNITGQNFIMTPEAPSILALNTELDFGEVESGQSQTKLLGLSNIGKTDLTLNEFVFTDDDFNIDLPEDILTDCPEDTSSLADSVNLNLRRVCSNMVIPAESQTYLSIVYTSSDTGVIQHWLTIKSNDPEKEETRIKLTARGLPGLLSAEPMISAEPLQLSFDSILIGTSKSLNVTVTNTGSGTLQIGQVSSSRAAFMAYVSTISVESGKSSIIAIYFTPEDTNTITAQLSIESNAADSPILKIDLVGKGYQSSYPGIQVVPPALEFGQIFLDSVGIKEIILGNTGEDSLLVTGMEFSNDYFIIIFNSDVIIAPGGSKSFWIYFHASKVGIYQDVLTIYNSDPQQTTINVPIRVQVTEVPPEEIRLNPSVISFGKSFIGESVLQRFWVVNPNPVSLYVFSFSATVPVFQSKTEQLTLSPHDSNYVEVEFTPAQVGSVSGLLILSTNVENRDTVAIELNGEGILRPDPDMLIEPVGLNFGTVALGGDTTLLLKLSNSGEGPLEIKGMGIDNPVFTTPFSDFRIDPLSYRNVIVTFQPYKIGVETGVLSFQSNDPDLLNVILDLRGAGVDTTEQNPLMQISPRVVDFGDVIVRLSGSEYIGISNVGKDTLIVTDIRTSHFEFKVMPAQLSITPGSSQFVTAYFSPLVTGERAGEIVIHSNDQLSPLDTILVSGTGVPDTGVVGSGEIFVPGGVFVMGNEPDAGPEREVAVYSFYMDAFEVTNAEYKEFIDAGGYFDKSYWTNEGWEWRMAEDNQNYDLTNPKPRYWGSGSTPWESDPYSSQANSPVIGVNWYEACAYARFRGKTLPTETQWEYAARNKDGRTYPWGENKYPWEENWLDHYVNHGSNRSPFYDNSDGYSYAAPVGSFPEGVSTEGIYDLAGNVWEWCLDWYVDRYDPNESVNPLGPSSGEQKIVRGGSWFGSTLFCRSFHRNKTDPQLRYRDGGIRLVRNY